MEEGKRLCDTIVPSLWRVLKKKEMLLRLVNVFGVLQQRAAARIAKGIDQALSDDNTAGEEQRREAALLFPISILFGSILSAAGRGGGNVYYRIHAGCCGVE